MSKNIYILSLLGLLAACPQTTNVGSFDAGPDLENRCVPENSAAGQEEGAILCGSGSWCDRESGICKLGECGYDDECEEALACDGERNICVAPCDLGDGIGCECRTDGDCPALSFCWGGNCLNAGANDCGPQENGEPDHSNCARDPSRIGDSVQVIQCVSNALEVDCVDDRACLPFGAVCDADQLRCIAYSCMRPVCARDGDCSPGQRCHPTANTCVEDLGCRYANLFPELACPTGKSCDMESNTCREIEAGECTRATQEQDCREFELCDDEIDGRCVQCLDDTQCTGEGSSLDCSGGGECPQGERCVTNSEGSSTCRRHQGTHCNVVTGRCIGGGGCLRDVDCMRSTEQSCSTDLDCPAETYCLDVGTPDAPQMQCLSPTGRVCALANNECVIPLCSSDENCQEEHGGDPRWSCDQTSYRCRLPEPSCPADADEPNNNSSSGIPMSQYGEGPLFDTLEQILCRGDQDFYKVQAESGQNLEVTLSLPEVAYTQVAQPTTQCFRNEDCSHPNHPVGTVCIESICQYAVRPEGRFQVDIFSPEAVGFEILGTTRLAEGSWSGSTSATALVTGTYYIRVKSNADAQDSYAYRLQVNQSTPPPCEIDEPNNSRQDATGLSLNDRPLEIRRFICDDDIDTYAVRVPQGHTIEASIVAEAEQGDPPNFDLVLLSATGREALARGEGPTGVEAVEWTNEEEGPRNVYVKVNWSADVQVREGTHPYVMRMRVAPPFQCGNAEDVPGDPDGSRAVAMDENGVALVDDSALCSPEDVDLFKVMLNPGERLTARLSNSPRFPLDLRILDVDGATPLHYGAGPVGHREARAINAAGGQAYYYIWVGWNNQATQEQRQEGAPFILNLGVESSELCPDPEAEGEPNNEQAQASFLPPGVEEIERHFCGETDVDWYLIQPEPETEVRVTAAFAGGEGDIDLYLFDANEEPVAASVGVDTDEEEIHVASTAGGAHYLMVDRWDGQDIQSYRLTAVYSLSCDDDDREAAGGNTLEEAQLIRDEVGNFDLTEDLVLCFDSDWYQLLLAAGDELTIRVIGDAATDLSLHRLDEDGNSSGEVASGRIIDETRDDPPRSIHELRFTADQVLGFYALQVRGPAARRAPYRFEVTVR